MNWILGAGCLVLFVMMNVALDQRDEARKAAVSVVALDGKNIILTCRPLGEVVGND